MNTMEVLTLLLVVFAALSYIDNHFDKKKQHPTPPKVQDAILRSLTLLRANRTLYPIASVLIIHQGV